MSFLLLEVLNRRHELEAVMDDIDLCLRSQRPHMLFVSRLDLGHPVMKALDAHINLFAQAAQLKRGPLRPSKQRFLQLIDFCGMLFDHFLVRRSRLSIAVDVLFILCHPRCDEINKPCKLLVLHFIGFLGHNARQVVVRLE